MTDDPKNSEAERVRRDLSVARRSLLIIFGVGTLGSVFAIVFVMRHLPEGELQHEVSAPVPHAPDGYDRQAKPNPCKKLGDPCDLSPGTPGVCAAEKTCTAENCLYCRLRE